MKTLKSLTIGLLLMALAPTGSRAAVSASELLQQGLYAEEVEGNLKNAIQTYAKVIQDNSASRSHIAQALYRQGMCYLKLQNEPAARAALGRLVSNYSDQTGLVAKARPVLEELTNFDPATLMPTNTLAYLEIGSPGQQIETILNLLKGTPFENPLATFGAGAAARHRQKNPTDFVGALMNPSMVAEFKKIRSLAIGVTGMAKHNPPAVAVLYPGKSDALKGLILAALGMAGTPGEPLEGMKTVNIHNQVAVAYDNKVIILAHPPNQLAWSVKQYRGVSSGPSLATSSPSFAKLGKSQRQRNAVTLWAKVDEVYGGLTHMFPGGHIPPGLTTANAIGDFSNMNDLILALSLQTNCLEWQANLEFKDGHQCLPYDVIRTPNISRSALNAVPAGAIGLVSLALNPRQAAQAEHVRAGIQNVTGLDLGREIFANLNQVIVFAMPMARAAQPAAAAAWLPNHLVVALTSRDPEKTRRILDMLFGAVNTMSSGQPPNVAGRYQIGQVRRGNLVCYLQQVNGTTFLSLNHDVLNAALTAIKNHDTLRDTGLFRDTANRLAPTTSKLILVGAGRLIRVLAPQMTPANLNANQTQQWKSSFDQLVRATESTVVTMSTDERLDSFAVDARATHLPPLHAVLGPVSTLSRITREARAEAMASRLRRNKPAVIVPTPRPPVIDGQVDDLWQSAHTYALTNVVFEKPASPDDLSAEYRALWDATNLYMLVEVTDDVLSRDTPPDRWFESDGVEVYLDATNRKSRQYGPTQYQYTFNWDKTAPWLIELKHSRTNGVQYAFANTVKGYRVEIQFPWSTLGTKAKAGTQIGLDVEINDNDGGGKRVSKVTWHDRDDSAWNNPQAFGNAELAGAAKVKPKSEPKPKVAQKVKIIRAAGGKMKAE